MKKPARKDILFEIGTEELPATLLADIAENPVFSQEANKKENLFEAKIRKVFQDYRLSFKESAVFFTPRRIVFWLKEAAPEQSPKDIMIKLLAKQEAYSENGTPTEKLMAILKHRSASLNDIVVSDLNGKPYVFIKKAEPIKETGQVLPEIFRALVKSLVFPKVMKWGYAWEDGSEFYFPRPIRSFLCLYGGKPVKFLIAGIKVENRISLFSSGGRKAFTVKHIEDYFKLLKKLGVILDPTERRKEISRQLEKLAKSLQGKLYEDAFLLNEVNFLVERPHALAASFDEEFLKLPLEVLTVSMARKQRIFSVLGKDGKVTPRFLAVLDGGPQAREKKTISRNLENILHAKLQDSLFFYKEDVKTTLEAKRPELKELVFLKGAGSVLEKTERLARLSAKLADDLKLSGEQKKNLKKAALLSKADLLTQMVGEFPELQGVMGKYYALESGEDHDTASAIGEQYLPRTAQGKLPQTPEGALLSVLDKIDLIVACFGLGLEPTSSLDPYGLRRSATAVVKIVLDKKIRFSFGDLLAENKRELGAYVAKEKEAALLKKLETFFKDRFKAVLADRGFREDLVEAVISSRFDDWQEAALRVEALSKIVHEKHFMEASKVIERTVNILKSSKESLPTAIEPSLFKEEVEREVYRHFERHAPAIRQAGETLNYGQATSLYAEAFFGILGEFFEKVFVNTEESEVRKNRLLLLRSIKDLYTEKIADLSKIDWNNN